MKHPLQPASHSGAVLRRTRRVDGVKVNVHCARRRLSAAHRRRRPLLSAGHTDGTVRGCPRRPETRRRRRRVAYLPPRRSEPRRPHQGAVLEVSPVPSRKRLRRSRNAPEIKKETTHVHHSWRRLMTMTRNRRGTAGRRDLDGPPPLRRRRRATASREVASRTRRSRES